MKKKLHNKIVINGSSLAINDLVAISRRNLKVGVAATAKEKTLSGRKFLDGEISSGKLIYGANTGFGGNVGFRISKNELLNHQVNLINSLSVGTPPFLNEELTRGFLLSRLNCLAKGYSGVRPVILEMIGDFINHNALPQVSRYGSIGASGDLVPSASLAAALMGKGKMVYKKNPISAGRVIKDLGYKPVIFQPKEALAIVNNTSAMSAIAAFVIHDFKYSLDLITRISALYVEVLGGITDPFADSIQEMKNHPGARMIAGRLREFLKGSSLAQSTKNVKGKIQDHYSIRCLPQALGPYAEILELLEIWVTRELNSVNDNPVINWEGEEILHGGNFSGFYIGFAMDITKMFIGHMANLEQTIIDRVLDHEKNQIFPPALAKNPGLNSGMKGVGISSGSYFAEIAQHGFPHSVFSRPFESGNQDLVSLGTLSALSSYELLTLNNEILARLLIVLCSAADFRGVSKLSKKGRELYRSVRRYSVFHKTDDFGLADEIGSLSSAIRSGQI